MAVERSTRRFLALIFTVKSKEIFGKFLMEAGGTPIYELHRYVPRDRVWFLEVLGPGFRSLMKAIVFAPFCIVPGVILR